MGIASCKKNHTCDCNYTFNWPDGTTSDFDYEFDITDMRRNEAKDSCASYQDSQSNYRYSYDCKLR